MEKKLRKTLVFLMTSFILSSCSGINMISSDANAESSKEEDNSFFIETQDITISPGKVSFIDVPLSVKDGHYQTKCRKKTFHFLVKNKRAKFYLAENYFSRLKRYQCTFSHQGKKHTLINVIVKPFKYKREKLNVAKRKIDLNKKDLDRVIREKAIKKNIYNDSADHLLFNETFKVPLKSYITSHYGVKRIFNNKKQSQHLGNDFRAKIGTPIPSTNKGKVAFVGDLFFSGKIVVIDHGLDIFTAYMHLSKIGVKKGERVNRGQIIGLSGMTGRVSGPHLHWGTRINGMWVDGFSLVESSKKNFK